MMSASSSARALPLSPDSTYTRKKRQACDECHLSKVRCTGEISGCQRCQRGNRFCHYSESNMGRTLDGAQRGRKAAPKPALLNTSHGNIDEIDWVPSSSTTSTTTNAAFMGHVSNVIPTPESDHFTETSINAWDGYSSLWQRDSDFDVPDREPSRPAHGSPFTNDDMGFEGIDAHLMDGDAILAIDPPQDAPWSSSRSGPQQHQRSSQAYGQVRAPTDVRPPTPNCVETSSSRPADETRSILDVQFWTRLLDKLSRSGDGTPVALDDLLHNSSTLVPKVVRVLQSERSDPSYMATLLMILLCVTQIVAHFEQCIPSAIHGLASSGSKDIALCLGAYKVDREAQQALQRHLVAKELSRIHHVAKLSKQVLQQPGLTNVSKRTHYLLLNDLQARAKSLTYLVREKWGAASQLVF